MFPKQKTENKSYETGKYTVRFFQQYFKKRKGDPGTSVNQSIFTYYFACKAALTPLFTCRLRNQFPSEQLRNQRLKRIQF